MHGKMVRFTRDVSLESCSVMPDNVEVLVD